VSAHEMGSMIRSSFGWRFGEVGVGSSPSDARTFGTSRLGDHGCLTPQPFTSWSHLEGLVARASAADPGEWAWAAPVGARNSAHLMRTC
jgi:hypothetical protein